jgi:hypothetical protein
MMIISLKHLGRTYYYYYATQLLYRETVLVGGLRLVVTDLPGAPRIPIIPRAPRKLASNNTLVRDS